MKLPTLLFTLLIVIGSLAPASRAANIPLTEDGKPVAVIILSESVSPQGLPARALISHIRQMSGATLTTIAESELSAAKIQDGRIIPPPGKTTAQTFILLGEGELTRRLGLSFEGIGPGGVVIKSGGNTITLMAKADGANGGRNPLNAQAVFRFLELLGCRCLWPGEIGKVVPEKRTITVSDLNIRFTPPIGQRYIRFAPKGPHNFDQGLAYLGLTEADWRTAMDSARRTESDGDWNLWNGQGGSIGISGGHAGAGLRGGWAEHGKAHPEWFALQPDGSRDQAGANERWRLCVSNPGLIEHVANDIITRLNGHAQNAISLSPNDGGYSSFCMCDECKKLDAPNGPKITMLMFDHAGAKARKDVEYVSLTDRYVHYWNAVAERVTKVVPDQLFIIDAYSYYSDPPVREKLHPNLVVRYVPTSADGWKGWQAAGAKRSYWRPNNLHSGYRDGALKPTARTVADTLHYLSQNGMLATDITGIYDNWATQGLEYYAAARISWDPSESFDSLLDDYCRSGFGAGAELVKKYFLSIEKGVVPRVSGKRGAYPAISPQTIDQMRALLIEAAKSTEMDLPSHRRVAFLRAGLEFTAISAEAHRFAEVAEGGAVDTKAATAVLERRWQMMRALVQHQPLAVNVAVVAGHDATLNSAVGWKGPTEAVKGGKLKLQAGDDWLNEDQSVKR